MADTYHVIPQQLHDDLVSSAYQHRGYTPEEAADGARFCSLAAQHGIRTHNALKALHLDELFGSKAGGCTPGAEIAEIDTPFAASKIWDAQKKLGQSVAFRAIDECIALADQYGIGQVSVDNAFHYLWGGGYVIDAAQRGYIAYTNCTSTLAEVVPFMGKHPTLGTNPHSWGFPTTDAIGFPIVVDWATSVTAMGRVQQFKREGKQLPPDAAVDKHGNPTTDPNEVAALLPFGAHKGYGLSLINELVGALIGGFLPTLRGGQVPDGEKQTSCFYFSVIHPDAISGGAFASGRGQQENLRAVLDDILGHGNDNCLLPGEVEAKAAGHSEKAGGLLFTGAECDEFQELAQEIGAAPWDLDSLATYEV